MAVNRTWPERMLGTGQWCEIIGKGRFEPGREEEGTLNTRIRRPSFAL